MGGTQGSSSPLNRCRLASGRASEGKHKHEREVPRLPGVAGDFWRWGKSQPRTGAHTRGRGTDSATGNGKWHEQGVQQAGIGVPTGGLRISSSETVVSCRLWEVSGVLEAAG